ncbi:hypothetical protein CHH28_10820 [Bacterioplanes sanyensis]|uniref:SnoaL-like domain-containing protein n=1 Tax=Bacterioplanes sanyensis TaxID=1249553 RepID=A0A222FKF6_9GAMM|nr:nuclear transport factor 2 family protein [Bacterioplanes sanyensis]ASP39142.1 hypothetical protein CHH28_10820 [Bacterioplanes sanyensis]
MTFPLLPAMMLILFGLCLSHLALSQPPSYGDLSAETQVVGERYMQAYIARDWDVLADFVAESATFSDPTATMVFGQVLQQGKSAMMANFRSGYASITHMQFHPQRTFFAGDRAVFEGTLDWDLTLQNDAVVRTRAMPFVTILTVTDGKVQEHTDYADYQPFLDAYQAANP